VVEMGPDERKKMTSYLAARRYRTLPEHCVYGGLFVTSWSDGRACKLRPANPVLQEQPDTIDSVLWGTMDQLSLTLLRDVEGAFESQPVLALAMVRDGIALFHGIHDGKGHSHICSFDPNTFIIGESRNATTTDGQDAVIVNQGWSRTRPWNSTAPLSEEVQRFQHRPRGGYGCSQVDDLCERIRMNPQVDMPMAACIMEYEGKETLITLNAPIEEIRCPGSHLPYQRGRYLAEMAMGGYWYSAARGVGFRAYLKGDHGIDNIWPIRVLGWRLAITDPPDYIYAPSAHSGVKTVTVVGGVANEMHLCTVAPDPYSRGHVVVDPGGTRRIEDRRTLEISPHLMSAVASINGGKRFYEYTAQQDLFLDAQLNANATGVQNMSLQAARATIESVLSPRLGIYF
jgi:hypothetical protein